MLIDLLLFHPGTVTAVLFLLAAVCAVILIWVLEKNNLRDSELHVIQGSRAFVFNFSGQS